MWKSWNFCSAGNGFVFFGGLILSRPKTRAKTELQDQNPTKSEAAAAIFVHFPSFGSNLHIPIFAVIDQDDIDCSCLKDKDNDTCIS